MNTTSYFAPLIFGVTPFGCLCSMTLTPYLWCEYHSWLIPLFYLRPLFHECNKGVKQELGVPRSSSVCYAVSLVDVSSLRLLFLKPGSPLPTTPTAPLILLYTCIVYCRPVPRSLVARSYKRKEWITILQCEYPKIHHHPRVWVRGTQLCTVQNWLNVTNGLGRSCTMT